MRTQMSNIWKYLDDLAESDPAKYCEFQRQQRQIIENEMKFQNDVNLKSRFELKTQKEQNQKHKQANKSRWKSMILRNILNH